MIGVLEMHIAFGNAHLKNIALWKMQKQEREREEKNNEVEFWANNAPENFIAVQAIAQQLLLTVLQMHPKPRTLLSVCLSRNY